MSGFASLLRTVERRLATAGVNGRTLALALSGGMDSMVLLDVLGTLAPKLGFHLSAMHVHHGLSPHADDWAGFCERECARRGIPLRVEQVRVARDSGLGLEAAARHERYRCLRASGADVVVTAHHLDDQAETVLLHVLRGAGVEGMAAMPVGRSLGADGPLLVRPLLEFTRSALHEAAIEREVRWITDESNTDVRHARNFLRAEVLPLIETRFPAWRETLARVAVNAADAGELAAALAAADLARVLDADGLLVAGVLALTPARRLNVVRHWLRGQGIAMPSRQRLEAGLAQLLDARGDATPCAMLGGATLRRHAGRLLLDGAAATPPGWRACWNGEAALALPDGRTLHFDAVVGNGLARATLTGGLPVAIGFRTGGERLQLAANRPRRALKKLLQEAGMPPWERSRLPLLTIGDDLAWVDGIGIDAVFAAGPGEPGVLPRVGHR